ncbi:hypothetical protein Tco_1343354, partial [Tanacetum coccineum]
KGDKSLINTSFLGEYKCSSLALERERRDEKKRLDHLKQDQEMLVIKIFSERKKVFRERKKCEKIRAKRSDFQQEVDQYLYTGKANDPNNWIHEYFNNIQNSSSSSNPPTPSSANSSNSQIPPTRPQHSNPKPIRQPVS